VHGAEEIFEKSNSWKFSKCGNKHQNLDSETSTNKQARCWWFTPAILSTWEGKIRRMMGRN
jgi:hypothetical protein